MYLNYKTIASFGYCSESLKEKSQKPVWCRCDYCSIEFITAKRFIASRRAVIQKDSCGKSSCRSLKSHESKDFIFKKKNPLFQGTKFGSWTIISETFWKSSKNAKRRAVLVRCSCGNIKEVLICNLRQHKECRCFCLPKNSIKKSSKRLYRIWYHMKHRCENPKNTSYKYYGKRGIKVCKKWQNFSSFEAWAFKYGYQDSLSIDRINPIKNYCASNCEWVTISENSKRRADWYANIMKSLYEENALLKEKIGVLLEKGSKKVY